MDCYVDSDDWLCVIHRFQHHVITPVFKYITVRGAYFDDIIMSQGKRP